MGQDLEPVSSDLSTAAEFSATVRRLVKPCYSASVRSVLHQISRSVLTASHLWHTITVNGGTRVRVVHHQNHGTACCIHAGNKIEGGEGLEAKANDSQLKSTSSVQTLLEISLEYVCREWSVTLCEPGLLPCLLVSL